MPPGRRQLDEILGFCASAGVPLWEVEDAVARHYPAAALPSFGRALKACADV
jgi:hypothetical protein